MANTQTTTGIVLIEDGAEAGSWGDITNTNLEIVNRLTSEGATITLSGTTHSLQIADGVLSDGQYAAIVFGGSPSGTNTVTISPNDARRVFAIKNSSGESVVMTQGSGSDVTIPDGLSAIVYCDGQGSGASVVAIIATDNYAVTTNNLSDLTDSDAAIANLGITATTAELNILDGVTATTAELNILDGITATTAELNILDGVTATTAELNIMDGVTATTAEINVLDGDTSATPTTLVDADRAVLNDDGTMTQVAMADFTAYFESNISALSNVAIADSELQGATTEKFTNSTSAASGVVNFDCKTQSVYLNSANASGNVQLNFRGDGSTTFADIVPVGKSLTAVYAVNNGSTPYYVSDVRIDGTSQLSSQEFFWQGGTQPSSGNASGMDVYTFTFFRRHASGWTIFADRTFYGT